jgi:hypothetical protein
VANDQETVEKIVTKKQEPVEHFNAEDEESDDSDGMVFRVILTV